MVDRRSYILFLVMTLLLVGSVITTYRRYVALQDFVFFTAPEQMPASYRWFGL